MSKQLTVTIAGKPRIAEFGYLWFEKLFHDQAGYDPFSYPPGKLETSAGIFDHFTNVFYAGVLAHAKMIGAAPEVTKEDVENFIGSKDDKALAELIVSYRQLFAEDIKGGPQAQKKKGK